jgi:hypothetical protein
MFKSLILTAAAVHVFACNLSADTITRSALAPAATLSVTPVSTAGTGNNIRVGVDASNLTDNFAEQFSILFDPKILSASSVLEGTMLTSQGSGLFIFNIDNTSGEIGIAYTGIGPTNAITGNGELVSILFSALELGTSRIDIANTIFLDQHLATQDVAIVGGTVNVVPEPASFLLTGAGLITAALLIRNRRRRISDRAAPKAAPRTRYPTRFSSIVFAVAFACMGAHQLRASGAIQSVSFSPSTVVAGGSTRGTVCLSFSQHTQALNVGINNFHPAASAPSFVTIPGGQQCAAFSVSTRNVQSTTTGQIGAYWIPDSTQSAYGTLTVIPSTTCTAPVITLQPQDQTIQPGNGATVSVNAAGTSPLTYSWRLNGQPAGTNSNVFTTPPLTASATVFVTVSNQCGQPVQSRTATITVKINCTPPSITSQTLSHAIRPGETVPLSVSSLGSLLQFQWYENGVPLAGATLSSYTTGRQYGGAVYSVGVSNACGTVTSVPIEISIGAPCPGGICAQPVHDVQVVARPLGAGLGDFYNVFGRHTYLLVTFADGTKNTYGAYPISGILTPVESRLEDPVDPPGGCDPDDSSISTSVCLPVVLRGGATYQDVLSSVEQSVAQGPEGSYSIASNNSNTWARRNLDSLVNRGIIEDLTLPASAVSTPDELARHRPTVLERLTALGLPLAWASWIVTLLF